MTNKTFDILKYIQRIALPAVIAFLATILPLCNVNAETVTIVTGIIAAFDTLLAALLQISTNNYQKTVDELQSIPHAVGVHTEKEATNE